MLKKKVDKNGLFLTVKSNLIVTLEHMLNGLENLQKDTTLPRNLRILVDATNSKVAFDINEIDIILKKMHKVAHEYNLIKHAVILNSPENTAFAMIINTNKAVDNYLIGIFSTQQNALKWLNNK